MSTLRIRSAALPAHLLRLLFISNSVTGSHESSNCSEDTLQIGGAMGTRWRIDFGVLQSGDAWGNPVMVRVIVLELFGITGPPAAMYRSCVNLPLSDRKLLSPIIREYYLWTNNIVDYLYQVNHLYSLGPGPFFLSFLLILEWIPCDFESCGTR